MKFMVTTERARPDSSPPEGFVETFLENLRYVRGLQEEGVVVDSGAFPGEHSSYMIVEVEDEDAVSEILEDAPLQEGVEREVRHVLELTEVTDRIRSMAE